MLFNSFEFLLFFPVVAFLYFVSTHCIKKNAFSKAILLLASLFFYACWNAAYLVLILFSVVVTYFSALAISSSDKKSTKKLILICALVVNLLILFFFKYFNFFANSAVALSNFLFPTKHLRTLDFSALLPVGISFYTFQALGYAIDVYRGTIKAEKDFLTYALFVTFFPQLVAGPIERSKNLLPQFKVDYTFDYVRVTDGLKQACFGMFKKIVIADELSQYVTLVYNDVASASSVAIFIATIFFALQIYCDFSGYSDIAIGVAKVLGFNLMPNFKKPYFSKSIREFWSRWHISLSSWFRDYLYIPLGGKRVSKMRHLFNLFVTFVISGLWHGAAWTFVAWGALHGAYQVVGVTTKNMRTKILQRMHLVDKDGNSKKLLQCVQVLFVFFIVCFAWVFFRANSLQDALVACQKFLLAPINLLQDFVGIATGKISFGEGFFGKYTLGLQKTRFMLFFVEAFLLVLIEFATRKTDGLTLVRRMPLVCRWILYYFAVALPLLVTIFSLPSSQFIYFQF